MTIIEKTAILEVNNFWFIFIPAIVCGSFLLISVISMIYAQKKFKDLNRSVLAIFISGGISVILAAILGSNMIKLFGEPSGRYSYKATADDKVSIVEIYEKYENITYDGTYFYFEDKKEEK